MWITRVAAARAARQGILVARNILRRGRTRSSRAGFTLVEVMLASTISLFMVVSLFEGLLFCRRIAEMNRNRLEADGLAWDIMWDIFNQPYDDIKEYPGGAFFPYSEAPEGEREQDRQMLARLAPSLRNVRYYKEVKKTVSDNGLTAEARILVNVYWEDWNGKAHSLAVLPKNGEEASYAYHLIRGINTRPPVSYPDDVKVEDL